MPFSRSFAGAMLALLFLLAPARAATPPAGTLSTASPQLTFTTGPHGNPTLGDCSGGGCDDFALTVQLPADYTTQHPNSRIVADLVYTLHGDLDLDLLAASGTSLDSSGEPAGLPEHVETPAASGTTTMTVRVIPFVVAGTTATVTVRLVEPVARFVLCHPDAEAFFTHAVALLGFYLPRAEREGKAYLTIGIGCTGGRHRSVAVATELFNRLGTHYQITVRHRELSRGRQP